MQEAIYFLLAEACPFVSEVQDCSPHSSHPYSHSAVELNVTLISFMEPPHSKSGTQCPLQTVVSNITSYPHLWPTWQEAVKEPDLTSFYREEM